ncbi:unnamed protein product [Ostreobium quekettii]|uniref:Uncharacterized protein n=1 Tax=Ostreobium quekettii TaxID=121088 RepID=A0A8S1ISW2_9CHLO|nr:unnamed protein product [Ostreobium quekettii]
MASPGAKPVWFGCVVPDLLANQTIKEFLSAHEEEYWPEAIKLATVYGILALRERFGQQQLSVDALRDEARRGAVVQIVGNELPNILQQVEQLVADVRDVERELVSPRQGIWESAYTAPMERKQLPLKGSGDREFPGICE